MCQNVPMKKGIKIIYSIYYLKCSIDCKVVHVSMGEESTMRVESARKRHVERFFWEVVDIDHSHAWECNTLHGNHGFHLV